MPLTVEIVTAERVVLTEEDVDTLVAPGVEGQLGVLPRHAAFMTMLQPGELRLVKGGEEIVLAVTGGFLEVRENKVMILADAAERADEIDVARAEAARRRAEETLAARKTGVDLARAEAQLRRALARLEVVERRRRRPGRPRPS
jgi:F-type H+-transporting ATPase subunit epsilon